jgi:hypothetical protein
VARALPDAVLVALLVVLGALGVSLAAAIAGSRGRAQLSSNALDDADLSSGSFGTGLLLTVRQCVVKGGSVSAGTHTYLSWEVRWKGLQWGS